MGAALRFSLSAPLLSVFSYATIGCYSPPSTTPGSSFLAASILEHQHPEFDDDLTLRYVQGIAARLTNSNLTRRMTEARGEPPLLSPRLMLANSAQKFALSLPNNTLLISVGILRSLQNEAQLAFVIAHELAHGQLGHFDDFSAGELSASRRKKLELAADTRAIALIAAAGYDPRAALGALHQTDRGTLGSSTHPELPARQTAIITLIEESGWTPPGIINRRDFVVIQQRLRNSP